MPSAPSRPNAIAALLALTTLAHAQEAVGDSAWELLAQGSRSFSGTYPHLASFNRQNECGIGGLVPWGERLYWVTYAPHRPDGSDDRLYALTPEGELYAFSRSIGGTPANRLVHRESGTLFLGPYAIDGSGTVRVIPYTRMRGRPTGNARHLEQPEEKVYFATMEEGLYEVDVESLEVTRLFADTHDKGDELRRMSLPGYHGKGLYSGQGVLVYSNNGEYGQAAQRDPRTPSGVLAEWDGRGDWKVVRRNQFTEVTGPGGTHGSGDPDRDPIWAVGWDHRSLLLMVRSGATQSWSTWRLPKASHTYDGAHGWNTEWPRIRDIGEGDLAMTMHGTFWRFPRDFGRSSYLGLKARSTYLKVVGDFCRYGDQVVLACDDAAKSEFLNRRRAKGELAGPAESQSNLWFLEPEQLDQLGPALGRGGVFVEEPVQAATWSDPFWVGAYERVGVHMAHSSLEPITFRVEGGDGFDWEETIDATVERAQFLTLPSEVGPWVRVATDRDCRATVWFELRSVDNRGGEPAKVFTSLAREGAFLGGRLRAGDRQRGLQILATRVEGREEETTGYYELKPDLRLLRVEEPAAGLGSKEAGAAWMAEHVGFPSAVLQPEAGAVRYVDEEGRSWLLPLGPVGKAPPARVCREVTTERDLFHCAGTFYELPARNAGGFAKLRPIASHPFMIQDYTSWRGLLAITGVVPESEHADPHVIRSADGLAAVWLGVVDDLWKLGKPRGYGGPWSGQLVQPGVPSLPFLMAGFDRKVLELSHGNSRPLGVRVEVDITGEANWQPYREFEIPVDQVLRHEFPPAFQAYWVRLVAESGGEVTSRFEYD